MRLSLGIIGRKCNSGGEVTPHIGRHAFAVLAILTLAAAMTGCINDADVPSGNGDNPATGARGGNMEISFLVPNSSNGSRAASAEDSGVYEDGPPKNTR